MGAVTALAVESSKPIIRRSLAEGLLSCVQFKREDGEQLAFGQAVHSFIAAYTLQCKATGEETRLVDVGRLASEAWARTPGLLQSRWQEYMDLCQHFAESRPAQLQTLMHVEHTITLDVGFAILACTVDRIDRTDFGDPDEDPREVQIPDWKTERAELDHDFQARWYSQMVLLVMPSVDLVTFAVHALRDWWAPEPYYFRRGELDLWWSSTLLGLKARLDTPNAAPIGGPACPGCADRYKCPRSTAEARAIPETLDQAEEIFQETLRMEEGLDVRKKALKHFFSGHPETVMLGKEIGFLTPREENLVITAAAGDVAKFMRRKHMDTSTLLKVDKEQLNKRLEDVLVGAGLARHEYSKPAFKWRNHVPARDERKRKKTEKETTQ